jgi:hypothetical protein
MRSTPTTVLLAVGLVSGAVGVLAGCSGPADGTGYLQVSDLKGMSAGDHFAAEPARVTARLGATSRGCVTVRVDDVERMPLWPEGTRVAEDPEDPGTYVVDLPGGTTLRTGGLFEATGVVDADGLPFGDGAGPQPKIAAVLGYCALTAAPVAFADAAAITPMPQ